MRVLVVVGARPNFMKAAPLLRALARRERDGAAPRFETVLVHTGQHYDQAMSSQFFADLEMPRPDHDLGVGGGSHAAQTAEIMRRFEPVLAAERPDAVVVVGDVNSTLACALVAAKTAGSASAARPLIAHIEAGLRSGDRSMPEEINRILTDQLADLLFVTEPSGVEHLRREGRPPAAIHFVGNTMIDCLLALRAKAAASPVLGRLGLLDELGAPKRYALLTLHRPANVDRREPFAEILAGLDGLAERMPIIFPVHPRTRGRLAEFALDSAMALPRLTEPLGYLDFLSLMERAALVVTDSGGIQEETTCLGVPCVTVRDNTERPVTIEKGTNLLAGTIAAGIRAAIREQLARPAGRPAPPENWDGRAAERIVAILAQALAQHLPLGAAEPAAMGV